MTIRDGGSLLTLAINNSVKTIKLKMLITLVIKCRLGYIKPPLY